MSTQRLDQIIQIQDGKLTLTVDIFQNKALQTLINTFNNKQPLVIEEAEIVSPEGNKVTVKGKLSFMGASGEVTADFEKSGRGTVAFNLRYISATTKVSLPSLIIKSALAVKIIPDLPIEEITVRSDELQQLTMEARITTPWNLEIGSVPLTVNEIQFKLTSKGEQSFEATLKGQIDIANSTKEFVYTMPGQLDVSFDFPEIDLSRLIEAIASGIQLPWPSGFSLSLPPSKGHIKLINDSPSLHVTTNIAGVGEFLLSVFKVEQEWAVSVLIDLETPRLSSIPGLQSLAPIDSFADLSGLILYNGSKEIKLEALQTIIQGILPSTKLPDREQVLDKGLSILTGPSAIRDPIFRLLTEFLQLDTNEAGFTVSVSMPDPTTNSSIYLPFRRVEIQAGTAIDGRLGGLLRGGIVQAFLAGSVHTEIQKQPVEITVEGTAFPNGFLISGAYLGTIHFDPLPIQLSNLALMIGLSAQGIPSFGFAGTIDIEGWESSIALFINSAQPTQCMIAGSVSSLTLNDVVRLIMGQPLPDGLGQMLGSIGLSGIQALPFECLRESTHM
ncbi:hypothetical protein [Paenibacillus terrae]|uniref:Uncharacterized protein n=1 Tax=Paenibacillus terrae TaxID=159743 RepID=A0A0D7WYL2_9BACL|nr:hypothetical protein [Paenibacillus terrae]KJD42837.1 hypothetical protein QD47_25970 [Paenibacillus terrae]